MITSNPPLQARENPRNNVPDERSRRWMGKVSRFLRLDRLPPLPRKILVALTGGLFLIPGLIMIITPGPAFVLIPLGLAVLGLEFPWAHAALGKIRDALRAARNKWKNRKSGPSGSQK